jgi:REP element-mobilizing transposase RayT
VSPWSTGYKRNVQDQLPHRRSLRLRDFDYRFGSYFVTLCTHERRCLFGEISDGEAIVNTFGAIIAEEWCRSREVRAQLSFVAFVVMPNHFHGIVLMQDAGKAAPVNDQGKRSVHLRRHKNTLGSFMAGFKAITTRRINALRDSAAPVWQRGYYEHSIRDERDLERIRDYIEANPARWEEDGYHPDKSPDRFA